jgi:hypothetical protein
MLPAAVSMIAPVGMAVGGPMAAGPAVEDVPYAEEADDAAEDDQSQPPPRRSAMGLLMVFALCVALLGVAALVGVLLIMQRNAERRGELGPLSLRRYTQPKDGIKTPEAVDWDDAKAGPRTLGPAMVEIVRAEYGEVRGKDAEGNVIISDTPYLMILLRVENRQRSPINYRSWYGNDFKSSYGPLRVRLIDQAQHEFKWTIFNDVKQVRWHTPTAIIEAGKHVEDVIVFTLPENVEPGSLKFVRLELPSEAVGQNGTFFRFQISREMIEGL